MKIRRPWIIKGTGFAASWAVRLWMGTLRYRYGALGPDVEPTRPGLPGRYIYALWHENLLFPVYYYARRDMWPLISESADGQLIYEICRNMGFRPVRGSTTRGSLKAVRQLLRVGRRAHLWITPDGPRGPRRQVQPGVVYLASRTGLPIVPVGIGWERPRRLRSWDHFAVPRPWSLAACVTGTPVTVPANADKNQREQYRQQVERELLLASAQAERWAQSGRRPSLAGSLAMAPGLLKAS